MNNILKIPKDEPYWCNAYLPVMATFDMPDYMIGVKPGDDLKKKREPPKWPDKTPNPCLTTNHVFDPKADLKSAPAMIPEQVQEALRREVYNYHNRALAIKTDFVKTTVKDDKFDSASNAYWNVRFMPIMVTDLTEEIKKKLDKRQHFNLALYFADYLRLSLQQLIMDEAMYSNPKMEELVELYTLHRRLTCTLRMSMAQLKLDEGSFDYAKPLNKFRYRDIASRQVTNLRSIITLRSALYFSFFLYYMLYRFRYNPFPNK